MQLLVNVTNSKSASLALLQSILKFKEDSKDPADAEAVFLTSDYVAGSSISDFTTDLAGVTAATIDVNQARLTISTEGDPIDVLYQPNSDDILIRTVV